MTNETLRNRFPVLFPAVWRRHPENPTHRSVCYDRLRTINPDPNWLRDILWIIRPGFSKVPIAEEFWRYNYPSLNAESYAFWIEQTGIKSENELKKHFHTIRDAAWQIVQEFSIARWWFLRSIMAKNPYYDEVRDLAREGALIVDLGCGFGQELRHLKADGATGELYGVDVREDMWSLGLQLFKDEQAKTWTDQFRGLQLFKVEQAKTWTDQFRKIDIIATYTSDPLAEFANGASIFLLNDVISFWGNNNIASTFDSIKRVSKVGTKVIGWMVGQEGDKEVSGMQVFGDGLLCGCIPTVSIFRNWFAQSPGYPDMHWDVKLRLVDFEILGFDEEDQKWFASRFFDDADSIAEAPNELKALCFLVTRIR